MPKPSPRLVHGFRRVPADSDQIATVFVHETVKGSDGY
jgi:hypothetical protein